MRNLALNQSSTEPKQTTWFTKLSDSWNIVCANSLSDSVYQNAFGSRSPSEWKSVLRGLNLFSKCVSFLVCSSHWS